jgi:hypothetical protein
MNGVISYPGPPTGGRGEINDVVEDSNGATWYCTVAGEPGTWVQAASSAAFESAVRANALNQLAAPTAALNLNGQRITGLAAPQTGTDAAQALGTMLAEVILWGTGFGANIATPASQTWAAVPDTDLVNSAAVQTPATISFTPITDQVDVFLQFGSTGPAAGTGAVLAVATHGTTTPLAPGLMPNANALTAVGSGTMRITGLTPGTPVSFDLISAVNQGTTAATINVPANSTSPGAGGAPLIMRAFAR